MELNWMSNICVIDRSSSDNEEVWYSFAVDELLCTQVALHKQTICHLWTHPSAVILGQRDSRLNNVKAAIETLEAQQYKTCIRHSGGAAVPLDSQVLNVSLIFPLEELSERTYNDGFEKMYQFIQKVCQHYPYEINKGEVVGAYCPGDYDLSVQGLKFCGIAQRRKVNAYIVQAFINIDGDSIARAKLIKSFYDEAALDETNTDYPRIIPETLASLAQFASLKSDEQSAMTEVEAFVHLVSQLMKATTATTDIVMPSAIEIENQVQKLKQRYSLNI